MGTTALLPPSTLDHLEQPAGGAVALWFRRAFVAALVLLVLAGGAGLLGVRSTTSTVSSEDGAWDLSLRHAEVARAGLDVPWQVTVRHEGGFDGPVTLTVSGDYFDLYETQGFTPEPAATTRDGTVVYLEFDPPPGDTLVVDYDAYIQPSSQRGTAGTVGLYDGTRVFVSLPFRTSLVP